MVSYIITVHELSLIYTRNPTEIEISWRQITNMIIPKYDKQEIPAIKVSARNKCQVHCIVIM